MNRSVLFLVGIVLTAAVGFGIRSMVYRSTADLGAQVAQGVLDPKTIQSGDPQAILAQAKQGKDASPVLKMVFKQLGAYNKADRQVIRKAALGEPVLTGEMDLDNPTGHDLRFLFKLLKSEDEAVQASAARALSEIGDPAFIPSLLTHSASASDPAYYCSAALAILDKQGEQASTVQLIEVTANPRQEVHPDCREGLKMTLRERGGVLGEGYLPLLKSEDPRVLSFALSRIPPEGIPDARQAVEPLTRHADAAVAQRAQAWIEAAGGAI